MVLEKIRILSGRQLEYGERVIQVSAGPKVEIVFARLQDPGVPSLVAIHANVFSQPRGKFRRVDDGTGGL
jgi:hypothetical protein